MNKIQSAASLLGSLGGKSKSPAKQHASRENGKRGGRPVRVKCDQCEMLSINGVPCHEIGCPNAHSRWDVETQSWIRQRKCFECGCTVDQDDPCCSENQ